MTLTIKDSLELTSPGKAGPPSQTSENKSGASTRSNPVCLEIPVTVRSLPGENGDTPGAVGPTREEGRSVIVFDNGAVLRLSNNLPSGQKIILSNAQGRDVVCRVVNGRNLPTVKGYIEVEFIEQVNDFWRIHQTGEPVSVPPPPVPVLALPTPVPVVPPTAPPVAPLVVPRVPAPEKETTSPSGSAPSFEDIAGLVRMSPAAADRAKTNEPAAQMGVPRNRNDLAYGQIEPPKPPSTISAPVPIPDMTSGKRPTPAPQEFSSLPVPKPAPSNDFMARGMLASGQTSAASSGEFRRRIPLIVGGVALVLAGFGAGYFLMHRGSVPAPAVSAAVTAQPSAPLPPAQTSQAEPVQMPQPSVGQAPAQPQPVSVTASVTADPRASTPPDAQNLRRPASDNMDAKESDRASKQHQAIASLKMSSPSAPRRDLGKLSDGSAPNVTDVSSAVAVGGAPSAATLSPVVRSESQPAPPPSLGSSGPSSKTIREPKLITSTHPTYPSVARQSNTQGTVVVSAEVDVKGNVIDAKAISGPVSLRQAAIEAVSQWKYSPALIDGKPARAQVTVDVQFRLN
jgi:periplasmic protein TonB